VKFREDVILNITWFVLRVCGVKYRDEVILNVKVSVVRFWGEK
jgi:hypothetical protein